MKSDPNWQRSRQCYVAYRKSKRALNKANVDYNKSYYRLEDTFEKYMEAQKNAVSNLDEYFYLPELVKAFKNFQLAKKNHDTCRFALGDALEDFRNTEIEYSKVIFKVLREQYGISIAGIGKIFGIWGSQISRWMRDGETKNLKGIYNKEFDIKDDENVDKNEN